MPTPHPIFNPPRYKNRRRTLRKTPTEPEQRLWHAVRARQLGVKFRRQHGIGHYIVDFYCPDLALVMEVDGDGHFSVEAMCHDQVRDAHLAALGLRVIRFTNDEIMCNLEGVLRVLMDLMAAIEGERG